MTKYYNANNLFGEPSSVELVDLPHNIHTVLKEALAQNRMIIEKVLQTMDERIVKGDVMYEQTH